MAVSGTCLFELALNPRDQRMYLSCTAFYEVSLFYSSGTTFTKYVKDSGIYRFPVVAGKSGERRAWPTKTSEPLFVDLIFLAALHSHKTFGHTVPGYNIFVNWNSSWFIWSSTTWDKILSKAAPGQPLSHMYLPRSRTKIVIVNGFLFAFQ
jgi:hypothetical protein